MSIGVDVYFDSEATEIQSFSDPIPEYTSGPIKGKIVLTLTAVEVDLPRLFSALIKQATRVQDEELLSERVRREAVRWGADVSRATIPDPSPEASPG